MAAPGRPSLPFASTDDGDVALTLVDLAFARAFWEGVPAARLLARIRLHRDEHDLVDLDARASGVDFADGTWDMALARILGASPAALERIKRHVARHARAATDEGPLPASDAAIAALMFAALASHDDEASPAEGAGERGPVDEPVVRGCALLDDRLGREGADLRAPVFEACLELATRASAGEQPLGALRSALDALGDAPAVVPSSAPLYPWGEREVPVEDRRVCLLERSDLERVLFALDRRSTQQVTTMLTEASALAAKQGSIVLVAKREARSQHEVPRLPPASWLPVDPGAPDASKALAAALERGATTAPRVRALLLRGGDAALDAAGREMLRVGEHPFASAVFAEVLAGVSRERDMVRLVSYFAIAPDPASAARALSVSTARELPTLLRNWLESMPAETLVSCLAALRPYPHLYEAVSTLAKD